ncbi:virulence plasmid 65kDa B protein-domain-containing protein [Rhexocercosporidium sp. MPI-PUGE-AT-0058]|nr:virulence plasmid 65kDa B protein-domain-containing protein [Rhexocercosporidium sp. MPI-PUGE-AT-0058]
MDTTQSHADQNAAPTGKQQPSASPLPSITLPEGGGAIQSMGEKFDVNPTTGTVLIFSYNSGSGNGPFGFGWSLSLGSITRKTSRGIPQYLDAIESDTFVFAGVEDLVPVLQDDSSVWQDSDSLPGYSIKRYNPRIEGPFSRIERCSNESDLGDVWWRVTDAKNQLTVYGSNTQSRIYDPKDPSRIFEWLTSKVRDQKGKVTWFRYNEEDGAGVDLARAHQQNRGPVDDVGRRSNRYIKSIVYGNLEPLLDPVGNRPQILPPERLRATA